MSLDVRASHNGRWIDQKCAPDVVSTVADCVLQLARQAPGQPMSSSDVWASEYAMQYVPSLFAKPGLDHDGARHEYDKWFQQPMEMLSYAGILEKRKDGNRNSYKVRDEGALEYISYRERNALEFLVAYIQAVVAQSGLAPVFERFLSHPNDDTYHTLKSEFTSFTIANTPINGETECWRIFIKVLNPLAFVRRTNGTERGRMSRDPITFDMLMYNRDNFRDLCANKPKGVPRSTWITAAGYTPNFSLAQYQAQKAMRQLRAFNKTYRAGKSEVLAGRYVEGEATQIHHMFPISRFPEIAGDLENLIALTPNQHYLGAHPGGDTSRVDPGYQLLCLEAKIESVSSNLSSHDVPHIYSFEGLKRVLHVGFDEDEFLAIDGEDYALVAREVRAQYTA